MSKEEKIENIKNVGEFYQALRNKVANTFNSYERCGIFDGWTENQKKACFGFGTHILSNVWLPIQKHYTNKERKKYQKIENKYEDICKRQYQQIAELQKQLAEKEQEIESLRENSLSKRIFKEKLIPSHCMEQYEKYEQQIDKLTQDKISFAIERLERVKDWCENHKSSDEYDYVIAYEPDEEDTSGCGDYFKEEINNQIKQLEEMK